MTKNTYSASGKRRAGFREPRWRSPWLIRGSTCVQNASELATGFLEFLAYQCRHKNKKRGGVMNTQNNASPRDQGFCVQDILWAVGIWSVILSLSPVVLFYVLMVN
jgi:hypothetical protein